MTGNYAILCGMAKRTYRVIVDLDVRHQAAREVIAGILRFSAKHPEWDLQMRGNHPSNDGFTLDPNWKPDGLIIDAIAERCSFRNGNYLKNLFAKRFGQTMSAFRSASR